MKKVLGVAVLTMATAGLTGCVGGRFEVGDCARLDPGRDSFPVQLDHEPDDATYCLRVNT